MGLDGNKMLSRMKRLSQVSSMKQVKPSSYALFPGYHCPLMGAMLTIKEIEDTVMVVIGPDECAYYTQLATSGGAMQAKGCTIVSVVLDQHDVTFGCQQKMDAAFAELMEEYAPKAVYLVTTCVVEVTGDDIDAMAEGYTAEYGLPVIVVHAENFKTDDHLPGIEHTLDASLDVMEPQPKASTVNVLGLRLGDFEKTEVCRFVKAAGYEVGMMLPGKSDAETIRTAPKAACNIVVHPVGLPLAKAMQKKFGTPYVVFERYADPERILSCYKTLFSVLGKDIPGEVNALYHAACDKVDNARAVLQGKTYISGNTALCNWELHAFMAGKICVKPQLLQISDMDEDSAAFREELLSVCDPLVTRAANIGAMRFIYPVLRPDFNIGAGSTMDMMKLGIAPVRMMNAYNILGFETTHTALDAFLAANQPMKMPPHMTAMMKGGAK